MRKPILLLLSILIALVSCSRRGVTSGVRVRVVEPEKSISIEKDGAFDYDFPEVLNCVDIQIVGDTLLVIQDEPTSDDPFNFKAYSIETLSYLGSFIPKGRGPGEKVSPNYLFAIYNGASIEEIAKRESDSIIQIFDWQGNYLYEIRTTDDIGDLAYDSKNKRQYCLESRTGEIIRYDMSEIL